MLCGLEEKSFQCPYCWEEIATELDLSVVSQTFIEDCQVCCKPIEIYYLSQQGEVTEFICSKAQ